MKKIIRLTSLVIAIMMIISALGLNFASTAANDGENKVVAILYHCASGIHMPYIFGHSWVCIENVSNESFTVGSETVEPGQMISAGLHSAHGMEFNKEMREYRGSAVSALKAEMTMEDLKKAEGEILSSRWHYLEFFGHNCTNFSCSVWKKVTGQKLTPFIFPFVIKAQFPKSQTVSLYIG